MRIIEKLLRKNILTYYISRYLYSIFFTKFFFEPDCEVFKFLKKKNKIKIIDIGASDGSFSKYLSTIFRNSNFYCFEPLNEFYQKFYLTINNKLKIYNFALSNKTTKLKIYTPFKTFFGKKLFLKFFSSTNKKFIKANLNKYFGSSKNFKYKATIVKAITGDYFKLAPDIIKIDVENYEYEVLIGLKKTIKKYKPIIFIENPNRKIDNFFYKNKYLKFQYLRKQNKLKKIKNNNFNTYNYLYIKNFENFKKNLFI